MDPETKSPLEPLPKMDFKAKLMGLEDANPRIEGIPETNQPMDEVSVQDQVMSSNVGKSDKSCPTEVGKDKKLRDFPLIGPWSIVTYNRRAKPINKSELDQNEDVDPNTIDKAKFVHGKEHIMENTVGFEKKKQKIGRPRKALGDIFNKDKGGSSGFNMGAATNAKSRLAINSSNGIQVNGMDIQETANDAADKSIQNYGHESPDIDKNDMDMSIVNLLENGSHVNDGFVLFEKDRLQEAMINVQTSVVGATSTLVKASISSF
ncbi:unnamed protein product [Malus baccata var. baccata]